MADLAARVSAFLPGWTIRGATLAMPGGLGRAMDGLLRPYLYPFFMASGYFTGGVLPKRLAALDLAARRLPPFGADPALPALIGEIALAGAAQAGLALCDATLLLAAHGSKVSPASRDATLNLVRTLRSALPFGSIIAGFLEEPPYLSDAARGLGPSICLPLFALKAGHAGIDVPERLSAAGFTGSANADDTLADFLQALAA